ncbi:hypothetical protein ANN_06376 [Periplaneta americana]|uniref:Uncharacterized protein n=1 Tax=Periplaneta americana TaxID=6978 RepID=A0ABQ8TDJ8_PERAM|nr:hypothetical protein ANN_06376 [Periplaneta americana]
MAGLYEGGNEPLGSLKAKQVRGSQGCSKENGNRLQKLGKSDVPWERRNELTNADGLCNTGCIYSPADSRSLAAIPLCIPLTGVQIRVL